MQQDYLDFFRQHLKVTRYTETEIEGHCPFHEDAHPSFTANRRTGLWRCYGCDEHGKLSTFAKKRGVPAPAPAQDDRASLDVAALPAGWEERLKGARLRLLASPDVMARLEREWTIDRATVDRAELGWDGERLWIPIRFSGRLINVRQYTFNKDKAPKYKSVHGAGRTWVYPEDVLCKYAALVLAEGEKDCIVLNHHSVPAITFTGGAGSLPDKEVLALLRGKSIKICYDVDPAGKKGVRKVVQGIKKYCDRICVIELPAEGMPPNGDATDYFLLGHTYSDFRELVNASRQAYPIDAPARELPSGVAPCSLGASLRPEYLHRRCRVIARVIGKNLEPYSVPVKAKIKCDDRAKEFCALCVLANCKGSPPYDPEDVELPDMEHPDLLDMIRSRSPHVKEVFARIVGLRCEAWEFVSEEHRNVEELVLCPDPANADFEEEPIQHTVYVIGCESTTENRTYELTGRRIPHPATQAVTHVISEKREVGFLALRSSSAPRRWELLEGFAVVPDETPAEGLPAAPAEAPAAQGGGA